MADPIPPTEPAESTPPPPPKRRPRWVTVTVIAVAIVVVVAGLAIWRGSTSKSTDAVTTDPPTTLDACHQKAQSVITGLDNGTSSLQVAADNGGLRNHDTNRFITLWEVAQGWAQMDGVENARARVQLSVDAICNGADPTMNGSYPTVPTTTGSP